jgi:hypothetical protein
MLSFRTTWGRWAALLVLVAVAGCGGGGPTLVPVSGTLSYKGKPLGNALVHFVPEGGAGRMSSGETDGSGRFKLLFDKNHEGAIVGKHKVSIQRRAVRAPNEEPGMEGQMTPLPKDLAECYDKYSPEKSTKVVEVSKSTRELNLDLD